MKCEEYASTLLEMIPRLWAFAWRISGTEREAEHILEQVYRQAFECAIDPAKDSLEIWLFSLTYSVWLRERESREQTRGPMGESGGVLTGETDDPANRAVIEALERLPDSQRMSMLLVAVEEFSYSDAAFIVGMPVEALISLVAEARQMIATSVSGRGTPAVVR